MKTLLETRTVLNQVPPARSERAPQLGSRFQLSAGTAVGACVLLIVFFGSDIPAWSWLYERWSTSPDDSHGLLVPAFSIWLLWFRRSLAPTLDRPISWTAAVAGTTLIIVGIAIRCSGIYTRTITVEAISVIPCVAGIVLCCGGWSAARWAWPSVLFLMFMIPLPRVFGGMFGSILQSVATVTSTYVLQVIGIPAVSEGNVIWLTEKSLGVAEACSGLRMLTSFFALAVGMCLVIDRPLWEKCVISMSAPVIAIIANILRISATAIAYEFGNEKMAELIFHDLAGWLMMPMGLLLAWAELFLLSKLFQKSDKQNIGFGSLSR